MQLRNPESVSIDDDHGRGSLDVDTDFDHGRRNKDLDPVAAGLMGEAAHRVVLLLAGHPAVQHSDAQACKGARRQLLGDFDDRCDWGLVGGIRVGLTAPICVLPNPRAHDEDPVTGLHLLAHSRPGSLDQGRLLPRRDNMGSDGRAASRKLAQGGDIQVAEHGHGDGTRDGSRRHDEHVGPHATACLCREGSPLLDAESMLLVDDDEAEVTELDGVLQQGVRAHDDACIPGDHVKQLAAPGRGALGAGEERHLRRAGIAAEHSGLGQRPEHRGDRPVVLHREYLRRREQRCLTTGVDHAEHRPEGHDCLPAPDITLDEPVHRMTRCKVVGDLLADLDLSAGEGERQALVEGPLKRTATDDPGGRGELGHRCLSLGEHDLQDERLLESQASMRLRHLAVARGPVHLSKGLREADDSLHLPHPLGNRIREVAQRVEDDADGTGDLP